MLTARMKRGVRGRAAVSPRDEDAERYPSSGTRQHFWMRFAVGILAACACPDQSRALALSCAPKSPFLSMPTSSSTSAHYRLHSFSIPSSDWNRRWPSPRSSLHRQRKLVTTRLRTTDVSQEDENSDASRIDTSLDPRLNRVRLSRFTGIEWGTDLSFRFVYVRNLDPTGSAAMTGQVSINDQLCEIQPVMDSLSTPLNVIGAPFDHVMNQFAQLHVSVQEVDLVFFRGSSSELKKLCSGQSSASPEKINVTVVENIGTTTEKTHVLMAVPGVNIRQLCVDNGINVYQSVTRWTNCKGKQLCGTCIVNIPLDNQNAVGTNRKSMDEESTLRENPESYRLSCVTFAYEDVRVETFPPVKASQWTR
jgi:ferredoxin